ncbi:MAG: Flp pilus assembly protein CpaB [Paraburkholderia sp.]|nr:Flp pilus assembly protein CpaB [Paraburkholderia sp.]MDE1184639.1 Flp pilus assembly protein CpaB [Paraburkholderia sp.]
MPNLTRIAAGLLIGLALLLGIFAWMLARRPVVAPSASAVPVSYPVVVATRPLAPGQPIEADALRVQSLPINPNGAFSDPATLTGRVPVVEVGADAPVLESQLSSGLAEGIQPGERALAVHVDEGNAVGNRLRPGNFVDVFFTLRRDSGGGSSGEIDRSQTRLLLSKVRVLAFGNVTAGNTRQSDPSGLTRTAVLAVPLGDVDRLTLAEASGRLTFALRNPRDDDVLDASAFAPTPGVLKTVARGVVPAVSAPVAVPEKGTRGTLQTVAQSTQGLTQGHTQGTTQGTTQGVAQTIPGTTPVHPDGSTRAAAGIALDELSGNAGNGNGGSASANRIAPLPPVPAGMASQLRLMASGSGESGSHGANGRDAGIEVIRGGRAETVAW